ncbi:glutamate-rich WD repeat-containing protein 1 [Lingula anatina]|uniref:Glutamate-rich WD repeat-containing protein 1 n=1 Tax=Lingula anatina TaxID=7574 RepID=A0A1S3H902_LINAN|nr:glutamate-rich WD repeat-containing protein 1 [Lingula anatina]|eukprot:XP_013381956.1 glutamate-rich WD repeat-containing protein 1 [Lingula anatina]
MRVKMSDEGMGSGEDGEMEYVPVDEDEPDEEEMTEEKSEPKAYLPGTQLDDGEELVHDESAYVMYHQAHTGAPCLSFDILQDSLGDSREDFPMTAYIVCGTQAERSHANHVIVMKMSNLHKTNKDEEDNDAGSESDSEDEDEKPELEAAMIKHNGGVNRVRATTVGDKSIAASWSEMGKVHIWDLSRPLSAVNDSSVMSIYTRNQESPPPLYTFGGHQVEGFAMDWSSTEPGKLATGDCNKNIHIWTPKEGGTWHVDQRPYTAHTASVEDIQWSPNEPNVFASCSVDRSIRIWDARAAPSKACMLTTESAHERDVNVISWNRKEPFIVSGGDDGILKIWDLRQFQNGKSVALFKHHTAPITSVEWHQADFSVFAASGSDDQITLWDLAVERDSEAPGGSKMEEPEVPPQLLFIHMGQTDIKELHWHPQIPGLILSTAHSGFNIFKTISV